MLIAMQFKEHERCQVVMVPDTRLVMDGYLY
jgi:hypothetical protein